MSTTKQISFLLLFFAAQIIHFSADPYIADSQQLLVNPEFNRGLQGWEVLGDGNVEYDENVLHLTNSYFEQRIVLSQTIPVDQHSNDMIVTVSASSDSIVAGDRSWQAGRLVVVSLRGNDRQPDYQIPYEIFNLDGSNPWQSYRMHIHVYPGISAVSVQVQLFDAPGRLSLRGLSLQSANEKPYWPLIQLIMLSLFSIFLFWTFFPVLKSRSVDWATSGGLIVVVLIVSFTTMPMSLKNDIYRVFSDMAPALHDILSLVNKSGDVLTTDSIDILKGKDSRFFPVMHFLFFMTASFLLFIGKSRQSSIQKLYSLVLLAISTECMQLFVMNRYGSIENTLVDVAGVVAGFIVYYCWSIIRDSLVVGSSQ